MEVLIRVRGLYYIYHPQFVPLMVVSLFLPIFSKDFEVWLPWQSLPVGFMSAGRAKCHRSVIEALPSFLAFLKSCTTLLKAEGHGKAGHSPKQSNLWNGAVPIKSQLCKESRSPRDRCRSLETHGGWKGLLAIFDWLQKPSSVNTSHR